MLSDPIADMLIRIKNGYQARKSTIDAPYSKIKEKIGQILVKEGYLKGLTVNSKGQIKALKLELKYKGKEPAMTEVKRISKPGQRIYVKTLRIPRVRFGFGITILSTPKGVMTRKEAKMKALGGEVICQVW